VHIDGLFVSMLCLLHNLSFDALLQNVMVKNGLVPKVCVELWVSVQVYIID